MRDIPNFKKGKKEWGNSSPFKTPCPYYFGTVTVNPGWFSAFFLKCKHVSAVRWSIANVPRTLS